MASTDISRIIGFWKGGKFIFRHWHRLLVGLWPEPLDSKKSAGYSHHSDVCCHGWDILQLCTVTVQLQVSALAEFWNSTQHCGEQKRNKFKRSLLFSLIKKMSDLLYHANDKMVNHTLNQWFPTTAPRHISVSWESSYSVEHFTISLKFAENYYLFTHLCNGDRQNQYQYINKSKSIRSNNTKFKRENKSCNFLTRTLKMSPHLSCPTCHVSLPHQCARPTLWEALH